MCFEDYTCVRGLPDGLQLAEELFGNEEVIANCCQWKYIIRVRLELTDE